MKLSRNTTNKQNKQGMSKKPRPEIRDDMDSRQNSEDTKTKTGTKKKNRKKKVEN